MSLAKIGQFLMTRFPEKVVLQASDVEALKADVSKCLELVPQVELIIQRLSVVEQNAVHKGAVADLIQAVKNYKDELVSMKTGLGLNRIGDPEIAALLNGIAIPSSEDNQNG